jgi:hypothetical protein
MVNFGGGPELPKQFTVPAAPVIRTNGMSESTHTYIRPLDARANLFAD